MGDAPRDFDELTATQQETVRFAILTAVAAIRESISSLPEADREIASLTVATEALAQMLFEEFGAKLRRTDFFVRVINTQLQALVGSIEVRLDAEPQEGSAN